MSIVHAYMLIVHTYMFLVQNHPSVLFHMHKEWTIIFLLGDMEYVEDIGGTYFFRKLW